MCRIAGIVSRDNRAARETRVEGMTNTMAHGGPDDQGIYSTGDVTLGHRRLSIIDLSAAGHQPMIDAGQGTAISYNGEVYNYREVRLELEAKGQQFHSSSDTEVISKAYATWGPAAFARLSGMFAFALLDEKRKKLFLVRDAGGIKPLYYFKSADLLIFASEVKAFRHSGLRSAEQKDWKKLFLSFGFLPHPYTTIDGVQSLTPGSYLEINTSDFSASEVRFIGHLNATDPAVLSREQHLSVVRESVTAALRRHLISDAPLGVFLSGGIDSSLLTLLASREVGDQLRTVSVNFKEAGFDERPYQKQVLDRSGVHNHQSFIVSEEMFWNSWDDLWNSMDQPSIDGVNTYFVSRSAHDSGLKAVLSGLGADELFGGYQSFQRVSWIRSLRSVPAKKQIARLLGGQKDAFARLAFLEIPGPIGDYLFLRGIHTPEVVARILGCSEIEVVDLLTNLSLPIPPGIQGPDYASFLETNIYMRNQLLKDTDYMSMRYSLEVRVPFLDQDLVRAVHKIGLAGNVVASQPKFLLTEAFADVLPREIVYRKKQGFVFPFHLWLTNGLNAGRPLISDRLKETLGTDRFLAGRSHWSKAWSGTVLENFKN